MHIILTSKHLKRLYTHCNFFIYRIQIDDCCLLNEATCIKNEHTLGVFFLCIFQGYKHLEQDIDEVQYQIDYNEKLKECLNEELEKTKRKYNVVWNFQ